MGEKNAKALMIFIVSIILLASILMLIVQEVRVYNFKQSIKTNSNINVNAVKEQSSNSRDLGSKE